MQFVADLHLHSKYSRAVSRDMTLSIMGQWARKKGIDILTTGDWTHPLWFRELQTQLEETEEGLYKLKSQNAKVKSAAQNSKVDKDSLFLLSTEISSIYSQGGKVRRIHSLIFSPNLKTAEKINGELLKRGCNLTADGRPIIGLSSKNLLELILSIDRRALLVPCHAWTPWFSLYGSNSGFDSIEECFGEYSKYVYGIETGLSSDPEMNWRIKELDNRSILSFSDAHSPAKMGREATVFVVDKNGMSNTKISYADVASAIKRDPLGNLKIGYTIEFYPEEGKYHYTGHRNCKVVQSPEESKKNGTMCPVCKRRLTVGVMHRVEQLAQQVQSSKFKIQSDGFGVQWIHEENGNHPPFVKLVPLLEVLAESLSSTTASQKVMNMFDSLREKFGSEIAVLLKTSIEDIEKVAGQKISEGIAKVRREDIFIEPGFDGEYGKVKIWKEEGEIKSAEKIQDDNQLGLF